MLLHFMMKERKKERKKFLSWLVSIKRRNPEFLLRPRPRKGYAALPRPPSSFPPPSYFKFLRKKEIPLNISIVFPFPPLYI